MFVVPFLGLSPADPRSLVHLVESPMTNRSKETRLNRRLCSDVWPLLMWIASFRKSHKGLEQEDSGLDFCPCVLETDTQEKIDRWMDAPWQNVEKLKEHE